MEITINVDLDGTAHVRTSLGHYTKCRNEDEAACYANGMKEGYNAAGRSLGMCHGFRLERQR